MLCPVWKSPGQRIISASFDKILTVWVGNGLIRTLKGHSGVVTGCAFSAEGHFIVSASQGKTLKVWDVWTGGLIRTLNGHFDAITACAISADGRFIASASSDKSLKVWETASGHCLATLPVDAPLLDCAWFPDGERLIAVGTAGIYWLKWEK